MRTSTVATAGLALALAIGGLTATGGAQAQSEAKKTPYWASISAGEARMRTGPGRNYPASWLYRRPGLPVRVTDIYKEWRKVEDPDGTPGWMLANLLTAERSAYVTDDVVQLRDGPSATAKVLWRAEKGVVGRISKCSRGWCWFDVRGQAGYVETTRLWGVEPGEELD